VICGAPSANLAPNLNEFPFIEHLPQPERGSIDWRGDGRCTLTCRARAGSVKIKGSTESFQFKRYFASAPTMLIQATQLRPGMILEYNNGLWRVMAISHITPGNWRGMVQTKLRNVKTGTQTENRFRSEDRVERIILSQVEMEFLYQEGDDFHFMNTETYDQITIPKELIEDVVGFLTPNLKVEVEFHETTPLNVSLPKTVNLKVVQTDPGMRSAAVTNTLKPATMDTGLVVQVPHFVQEGETITINTETREYMARAK
jgi:elongation factor P